METKELLQKRRLLKRKKPEFIRQDAHKKKKLCWSWRKPKGSDSKMRVSKRGYKRSVRVGWGSPAAVRGFSRTGLAPFTVSNVKDLGKADPKTNIIVIASGVGAKKKMEITEKALSLKFEVQNFKDPAAAVKKMKEQFEKRKKDKEQMKADRDKKKEAAKKEAEKKKVKAEAEKKEAAKKEKEEPEQTEEEKKLEEKKEKDKLLISTQ